MKSDCERTSIKRHSSCVFTRSGKERKMENVDTQNDYKTKSTKSKDKKKTYLFLVFCRYV